MGKPPVPPSEQSKLGTDERLTNLLSVLCIVAWRVFWLTKINRASPEAPAEEALTPSEVALLDHLGGTTPQPGERGLPRGVGEAQSLSGSCQGSTAR